jgi:hypothetical protein
MRRRILIFALALGTVLGFGAGFARLAACHRGGYGPGYAGWGGGWRSDREEAFERHVAEVCADAALRSTRARDSVTPNVLVVPGLPAPAAIPAPAAPPPAP